MTSKWLLRLGKTLWGEGFLLGKCTTRIEKNRYRSQLFAPRGVSNKRKRVLSRINSQFKSPSTLMSVLSGQFWSFHNPIFAHIWHLTADFPQKAIFSHRKWRHDGTKSFCSKTPTLLYLFSIFGAYRQGRVCHTCWAKTYSIQKQKWRLNGDCAMVRPPEVRDFCWEKLC